MKHVLTELTFFIFAPAFPHSSSCVYKCWVTEQTRISPYRYHGSRYHHFLPIRRHPGQREKLHFEYFRRFFRVQFNIVVSLFAPFYLNYAHRMIISTTKITNFNLWTLTCCLSWIPQSNSLCLDHVTCWRCGYYSIDMRIVSILWAQAIGSAPRTLITGGLGQLGRGLAKVLRSANT